MDYVTLYQKVGGKWNMSGGNLVQGTYLVKLNNFILVFF